jgi:N-acetylneuraminate 9-O-acetyltransferase
MLTPIFFWVSWRMARASQILTGWIIDGDRHSAQFADYVGERGDVVGAKDSPYLLPSMRDGEGTPSKDIRFEIGTGTMARLVSKTVVSVKEDLRWRLGLILMVLWVGNVTYR